MSRVYSVRVKNKDITNIDKFYYLQESTCQNCENISKSRKNKGNEKDSWSEWQLITHNAIYNTDTCVKKSSFNYVDNTIFKTIN